MVGLEPDVAARPEPEEEPDPTLAPHPRRSHGTPRGTRDSQARSTDEVDELLQMREREEFWTPATVPKAGAAAACTRSRRESSVHLCDWREGGCYMCVIMMIMRWGGCRMCVRGGDSGYGAKDIL